MTRMIKIAFHSNGSYDIRYRLRVSGLLPAGHY